MQEKKLLIHTVAKLSGVPASAIRYYVRQGLLTPRTEVKTGGSRYHYYSESDVQRILQIRQLQAVGYTLSEIRTLMQKPDFSLAAALEEKIGAVQENIRAEQEKLAFLRTVQLTGMLPQETGLPESAVMPPEQAVSLWNLPNALRARKSAFQRVTAEYTALGEQINAELAKLREAGAPPDCEEAQQWMARLYSYICSNIVQMPPAVFALTAKIGAGNGLFAFWNRRQYGAENTDYFAAAMRIYAETLQKGEKSE